MSDEAVSEVVGEMLMLSLVLLLVGVFAVSLGNFLPTERAPTVTVMMTNTTENVTLYHKGGDWVRAADLEVIIASNHTATQRYRSSKFTLSPEKKVFDLGSSITVNCTVAGDETVRLVTPQAVLFSGEVR
jgi:FlaG/FlaF family flagellin (archaellin)